MPVETLLLAAVVDNLKLLVWLNSEDGATGNNRPSSIVHALLHKDDEEETQDNDKFMTFESPEDYNEYMRKKMEKCQT